MTQMKPLPENPGRFSRLRDIAQGPSGEIYLVEDGDGAQLLRPKPKRL